MISRRVFIALLGIALLVANVNQVHASDKGLIEIDESNNNPISTEVPPFGEVTPEAHITEDVHELPSFSTPQPTTEPPVVEQELPEATTEKPSEQHGNHGLINDIHTWLNGLGESWKEHIHNQQETIKDILGIGKR